MQNVSWTSESMKTCIAVINNTLVSVTEKLKQLFLVVMIKQKINNNN